MNLICKAAKALINKGVYLRSIQEKVIPAQYFKTRTNPTAYLANSIFLPHINDEILRNQTPESNIASLDSLVLVQFDNDSVMIPKESAHFGYYKMGNKSEIVKLIDQDWFKDGALGLKTLHDSNRLKLIHLPGDHLQISRQELRNVENILWAAPAIKVKLDHNLWELLHYKAYPFSLNLGATMAKHSFRPNE